MQAKNGSPSPGKASTNGKIIVLAILLALTAIVLWLQLSPKSKLAPRKMSTVLPGESQSPAVHKKTTYDPLATADPSVPIAKLQEPAEMDDGGMRNLFDFYTLPPPKPSPQEQAQLQQQAAPPAPPQPASVCGNRICESGEDYVNCPTDCQAPQPPFNPNLTYIGYLSEDGVPVAFFTDGKEVFMGRINEIIANKYRITRISDTDVELASLNGSQTKTVPFKGNNPG